MDAKAVPWIARLDHRLKSVSRFWMSRVENRALYSARLGGMTGSSFTLVAQPRSSTRGMQNDQPTRSS